MSVSLSTLAPLSLSVDYPLINKPYLKIGKTSHINTHTQTKVCTTTYTHIQTIKYGQDIIW